MRIMRSPVIPFLLAIPAAPLAAQTGGGGAVDDTVRLQPIVVTTTRLPIAQAAPTASASVITGDEMRARGIANVAEALRVVPGAAVSPSGSFGGTTSLFLRGGERDYVRVLIDGVVVNQPGGEIDFANLTTDNVERIEVVRGPGSVLYGSDAMSGVIQIFTRRGGGAPALTASARGGSYATREGDIAATGGGASTAWSLAAAGRRTDGIHAFNNRHGNDVFSGSAAWTPDERTDLRLTGRYGSGRFHYPTDFTGEPVDSNAFRTERQLVVGLDGGRRLGGVWEARVMLGLTDADLRNDDRPDTEGGSGYVSRNEVARRSADMRLNARLAPAAVLSAGFEYSQQRDRNESVSYFDGEEFPVPPQRPRRFNRAVYAQAAGDLGDRASYTAGGRYDRNANFGDFVTYRLGGGLLVTRRTLLRAAVGTAFKEPTIFENYGGGFITGNPNLDPERSTSWEAAVEQRLLAGALTMSVTYFDQRFRDRIEFTVVDGVSTYENLESARASGYEIEARMNPGAAFSVTASYTALRTRASADDAEGSARLLRRPSSLAALALDYRPSARALAGVVVNYVGDRDDLDFSDLPAERVRLSPYTKVDLHGEVGILRSGAAARTLTLTGRVENVFDASYQSVYGFRTPGRTILVGARLRLAR